jgi:hypothetical protein
MLKCAAQKGLLFPEGGFAYCRTYSRYAARLITAIEEGILPK